MGSKFFVDLRHLFSSASLTGLSTLIVSFLIQKSLGPTDYGFWLILLLIIQYSNWLHLGIFNSLNRDIPMFLGKEKAEKVKELKNLGLSWTYILGALMLTLSVLILFMPKINSGISNEMLAGTFIISLLQIHLTFYRVLKTTENNFKEVRNIQLFSGVGTQIIIVITILFYQNILAILLSYILAFSVANIYALKQREYGLKPRFNSKTFREMIQIGFPIMLIGFVWMLFTTVDRIMISSLIGIKELGFYGISIILVNTLIMAPQIISQVLYPKLSFNYGKYNDKEKLRSLILKPVFLIALLSPFILGSTYFLVDEIVMRWLEEYSNGLRPAKITIIGVYFLFMASVLGVYLNSVNKHNYYLLVIVISLVFNIILNFIFISCGLNLEGVAIATLLSYFIYITILMTYVLKDMKYGFKIITRYYLIILVPFTLLVLIIWLLDILIEGNILKIVAFNAVYSLITFWAIKKNTFLKF